MKVGQKYKYKGRDTVFKIVEVFGNCVALKGLITVDLIDKEDLEVYYTPIESWHDITPDEFREWWGKKVWMWDNDIGEVEQYELSGFSIKTDYPYISVKKNEYKHASITKPE